ncbi:MAG: hypothetical protein MJK18_13665, partial [Bdellovibrionales bacterium]|nr:hypothetical protein [Bdellovibrionales bacterium]
LMILFASVFFRTPAAFLIILSMFHFILGLSVWWLPLTYFAYSLFFLGKYYFYFFKGHKRLTHLLLTTLSIQLLQL